MFSSAGPNAKPASLFTFLFFICLGAQTALAAPADDFVTTWKTDNPGTSNDTSIRVPMVGGPYDVDWDNDGTFDEFGLIDTVTHDYGISGTYTIRIQGTYDSIRFGNGGDKNKILSLDQWGTNSWTSMSRTFQGASILLIPATDTPDFSATTSMQEMFSYAEAANPDTSGWDTSSVTNMFRMFFEADSANPDTSGWDTSAVTDMGNMFSVATSANPDTSGWNTSAVISMYAMFFQATLANPDTSGWDTSAVMHMQGMFDHATSANPDTSGWDTSALTNMRSMFDHATSANPDTSGWDTSAVTSMYSMFRNATSANPDTSGWDTSAVTRMAAMFHSATSFDRDIGSWDVTSLSDATDMFAAVTLSSSNYESLLTGWDSQVLQPGVIFNGGNSTYCTAAAIAARANMIASDSWIITDGGHLCVPADPAIAPDLTPATDTGVSDSDDLTSDNTPDFDVACSAIGNTISLYTNNPAADTAIGTHVCTSVGTETAMVTTMLEEGVHQISYTDRNVVGESGHSPSLIITLVVVDVPVTPPPGIPATVIYTATSSSDIAVGAVVIITSTTSPPAPVTSSIGALDIVSTSTLGHTLILTFELTDTSQEIFAYWKYGPELGGADHWYDYGTLLANGDGTGYELSADGSTITITLIDGVRGDDDLAVNGTIIDPGLLIVGPRVTPLADNELYNISTRADVLTGDDIAIAGFVISGSVQKCIIVRGRGPSVGVPSGVVRLPDPMLVLKSGSTTIGENDNWTEQDNPDHVAIIEGLGKAPGDLLEAAIYICLDPGAYTALLSGYLGTTGVGIAEVIDADDSLSYLENISTRARVGTGDLVTIAGFIITGDKAKQILIRGRGPSVGVPSGVTRLSDPTLTLKSGATTIGSNDDWPDAANAADISATGKAPGDPLDSAILIELQPGEYTAILRGAGGVTGSGIVEVLDLTGRQ